MSENKTCKTCRHFEPRKTGVPGQGGYGECRYPLPKIVTVTRATHEDLRHCLCWEKRS